MPVPLAHPSPQVATIKNVSRHCPISLEGQNHPWLRNTALNCKRTPLRCGVCLSCQLPRPSKLCANYSLLEPERKGGGEEGASVSASSLPLCRPWLKYTPSSSFYRPIFAFARARMYAHSATDNEAWSWKGARPLLFFLIFLLTFL